MARTQKLAKIRCKLWFYIVPACSFACLVYYGLLTDLRYRTDIKSVSWERKHSDLRPFDGEFMYPKIHENVNFVVNTKTCHIPDLDPYGTSISKFIKSEKYYACPQSKLITYRKGFQITVDKGVVHNYYRLFSKCSYQPYVKRIGKENGRNVYLFDKFQNFTDFINVTDEFCSICCFDKKDRLLIKQEFAFVFRNETLIKLRKQVRKMTKSKNNKSPMNVIMIALESTSRLNFIRQMNFTRRYLQSTMEAVELMGYNKLGLNTFPNLVAMLIGITVDEMNDDNTFYDRYPFIWKDYMDAGYVTLMGEDNHDQAVFNYQRKGFQWKPVDYYMRPYVMALEQNSGSNRTWCSGNVLVLQSVLDKLVEFLTSYQDVPHFAFTFLGRPFHDNSNRLGIVDLPLLRTLTELNTRGLLDNTVLMIFGDHGSRYGQLRNTFQGRLEENLPAFYVVLPRWFRKTHSNLFENLITNSKQLTSNFDVYATLQDILGLGRGHLSPTSSGKYGTSLLRKIRTNRKCADLKIPIYFCACQSFVETYSTESRIVHKIVQWVVKKINTILFKVSHLCSHLTLSGIRQAWKSVSRISRKKTNNSPPKVDFVVQFSVSPSNAVFEANVRCFKEEFFLLGDILRINKYVGQSDCVSGHKNALILERYCYCQAHFGKF